jgi:hypothetical protein
MKLFTLAVSLLALLFADVDVDAQFGLLVAAVVYSVYSLLRVRWSDFYPTELPPVS